MDECLSFWSTSHLNRSTQVHIDFWNSPAYVALRIVNLGVDTNTPTGKLMLTMLGGVAEFERDMMLERQREGIAKARAAGKYKGRKPTARAKTDEIRALSAEGLSMGEIAKRLGIGKGSVHRALTN